MLRDSRPAGTLLCHAETGARRTLPAAMRGDGQVAGDLVAWLEPMGPDPPPAGVDLAAGVVAVVQDAEARELLRTSAPGALLSDTHLALAPDGTVAVLGQLSSDPGRTWDEQTLIERRRRGARLMHGVLTHLGLLD